MSLSLSPFIFNCFLSHSSIVLRSLYISSYPICSCSVSFLGFRLSILYQIDCIVSLCLSLCSSNLSFFYLFCFSSRLDQWSVCRVPIPVPPPRVSTWSQIIRAEFRGPQSAQLMQHIPCRSGCVTAPTSRHGSTHSGTDPTPRVGPTLGLCGFMCLKNTLDWRFLSTLRQRMSRAIQEWQVENRPDPGSQSFAT